MIEPYESIFSEWFKEQSSNTTNWNFDFEEAARDGFLLGIAISYQPMEEILIDIATLVGIRVAQSDGLFYATKDAEVASGDSKAEAIYKLVKRINGTE